MLKLINPDEPVEVEISGTKIKVRPLRWHEVTNLAYAFSKLEEPPIDKTTVEQIESCISNSVIDVNIIVSNMMVRDIIKLGYEILKISSISEEDRKN